MSDVPKDIVGREIKVGDTVAYGTKSEYSTLQLATVLKVIPFLVKNYEHKQNPDGSWTKIDLPDKLDWKFQIETETERYNYSKKEFESHKAKKTLDTPKRFVVVEPVDAAV